MIRDRGRVCVLTGASGVLGSAFISCFAKDYCIIPVHHEHELVMTRFIDPLTRERIVGTVMDSIRADLSQPSEIVQLCKYIIAEFGKVDLLINAMRYRSLWKLMVDESPESIFEAYKVNVAAPVLLMTEFALPYWSQVSVDENVAARRNVVNVSSTAGSYVYPDLGQGVYSMTKAALNFVGWHLANEFWDYGVRVNTVAPNTFPGIIPTERVLDQIIAFDRGDMTGEHVLLDRDGVRS